MFDYIIPLQFDNKEKSSAESYLHNNLDNNDNQTRRRLTVQLKIDKAENNEAKPQKLFYISEFLQTIEELHTNEGFAKMLEKGITCGQVDHKGKILYYVKLCL